MLKGSCCQDGPYKTIPKIIGGENGNKVCTYFFTYSAGNNMTGLSVTSDQHSQQIQRDSREPNFKLEHNFIQILNPHPKREVHWSLSCIQAA